MNPTPYPPHPTPHSLQPTPYTLHPTPYNLRPTFCTVHPTPYTLHLYPAPYTHTLHPTPYTLHPSPHTLHHTPYTLQLNPTPFTLGDGAELPQHRALGRRGTPPVLIAHKEFLELFCISQLPHKSVNLSCSITNMKNKLTDLCGN